MQKLQVRNATNKRDNGYYLGPFGGGWVWAIGIKISPNQMYIMFLRWAVMIKWSQ